MDKTKPAYAGFVLLVLPEGFEPPRLAAPPPKGGVSANSTTGALRYCIGVSCKKKAGIYRILVRPCIVSYFLELFTAEINSERTSPALLPVTWMFVPSDVFAVPAYGSPPTSPPSCFGLLPVSCISAVKSFPVIFSTVLLKSPI